MTTLPVGATSAPPGPESLQAGEDLSAFQFHAVVLRSDGQLDAYDTVTEVPIGILQNKPDAAGKIAEIIWIGRTKVEFGETVNPGDQIRFGTDSKAFIFAKDTDTTTFSAGICILGGASGEIGTMLFVIPTASGEE